METNASFYTFRPHYQRPLRIFIRHLHHSTQSADISSALLEERHLVRNVYNVKKNNCPLPIFLSTSNPMLIINISLQHHFITKHKSSRLKNRTKRHTIRRNVSIVKTMVTRKTISIIHRVASNAARLISQIAAPRITPVQLNASTVPKIICPASRGANSTKLLNSNFPTPKKYHTHKKLILRVPLH
jgi:hypothetical protein